jgi:hypothetical protein
MHQRQARSHCMNMHFPGGMGASLKCLIFFVRGSSLPRISYYPAELKQRLRARHDQRPPKLQQAALPGE